MTEVYGTSDVDIGASWTAITGFVIKSSKVCGGAVEGINPWSTVLCGVGVSFIALYLASAGFKKDYHWHCHSSNRKPKGHHALYGYPA